MLVNELDAILVAADGARGGALDGAADVPAALIYCTWELASRPDAGTKGNYR